MRRMLAVALTFLIFAGAGFQAQAGESAGGYYDLGVFAYEDGNFQEAEGYFKKALDVDPENPVYLHYLGRVKLYSGQYVEAREYLESARAKDPELPGLNYDLGLLYYKIEQYDRASDYFSAAADEDPANVLAAYYGGICLYRQKRYDEAGPLFKQAAEKSPSLKVNSTYYAGVCDYHGGDISGAEEKLTYVKENAESPTERENAEKWLTIVGQAERQKPYAFELKLHYLYDDNVPLDPTGEAAVYSDDADSGIYGYAMGRYNIVNRSDVVVGAAVARGQTWYSDLTEFNMSDTNADIYTTYSTGSWLFGLNYIPRLYTIDDEDYLLQHEVRPSLYWQPNRDFLMRLVYSYNFRDYRDSETYPQNNTRDGSLHDIYVDLYYHVFGGRGFIFGGLGYESSTADDDVYNYTRPKAKAGLVTELGWKVRMDLELYYYMKAYPNYPGETREDDKFSGIVSFTRPVYWDWLYVIADYNHITNNSNVDKFEYQSNTVSLGLEAKF
jgi:Tfp pilus assembly protein PilF